MALENGVGKRGWKTGLENGVGKRCWKTGLETGLENGVGKRRWKTALENGVGKRHWKMALETVFKGHWKISLEMAMENGVGKQHWKKVFENCLGKRHQKMALENSVGNVITNGKLIYKFYYLALKLISVCFYFASLVKYTQYVIYKIHTYSNYSILLAVKSYNVSAQIFFQYRNFYLCMEYNISLPVLCINSTSTHPNTLFKTSPNISNPDE